MRRQPLAVTIHDSLDIQGLRAGGTHLRRLLQLAPEDVAASEWHCRGLDLLGGRSSELQLLAERGPIPGAVFLELASTVEQMVEGQCVGRKRDHPHDWLIIESPTGDETVVITDSPTFLASVRGAFADVRDSPADDWPHA